MSKSISAALRRCDPSARAKVVASLEPQAVRVMNGRFAEWAHAGQLAPPGNWRTWVLMAGRGFGKTRAGAEWVMGCVRSARSGFDNPHGECSAAPQDERVGLLPSETGPHRATSSAILLAAPARGEGLGKVRVALVAASLDEARRVMVEGPSGILAVARAGEVREWSFARRRIVFANGAEATLFSGAHPNGLRGPEHDFAWCDELAKWRHPGEAWDNLQLGLRRGTRPRALVTTTPRRVDALTQLIGEDGVVQTGGGSAANPHLPDGWVAAQAARLGATLLKRQELDGELLEEVKGALWPRGLIEGCRASPFPSGPGADFVRVIVGVDPPASELGDACGIVVCGLGEDDAAYVLADASAGGLTPEGWARKVVATAEAWGASQVVAEANNGGDMIAAVLRGAGAAVPVKLVHARGSKVQRAAAVAALFEGGKARFAGTFPALEAELAGLSYDQDYEGPGRSPDRADAMVWALDALMGRAAGGPRVRAL